MDNFLILPRHFYENDTVEVAKKLLGKKLVRKTGNNYIVGIISETEAYRSDDPASHCYIGKTERNKSMFGEVGCAYVYISYGIHFCLNIVARDKNLFDSGGVLIRAVIPFSGINIMERHRSTDFSNLTNGPGKLTQAYGLTKKHDGADLTDPSSQLFVVESNFEVNRHITATPRIGISVAKSKMWRFVISKKYCLQNIDI